MRAHVWYLITKRLPFRFCGRCGLIDLKNKATWRALFKPCPGEEGE